MTITTEPAHIRLATVLSQDYELKIHHLINNVTKMNVNENDVFTFFLISLRQVEMMHCKNYFKDELARCSYQKAILQP